MDYRLIKVLLSGCVAVVAYFAAEFLGPYLSVVLAVVLVHILWDLVLTDNVLRKAMKNSKDEAPPSE